MRKIDQSIIEKKSELGKRRVSRVASSITRIVCDLVHVEFAETCCEFSVIDGVMSPDLRYADIFISFFDIPEKADQEKLLKNLNYDLDKRIVSKFSKISLKYHIAQRISQKMRLKYMPNIRFRITDEVRFYI